MLIDAVIFDMDGLMLDTESVYRTAWQQAAAEFGYSLSPALHLRMFGRNRHDAELMVLDEFGPELPLDRFRAACKRLEAEAFAAAPLRKKHGLDELLALLDSRRVPRAVATSTDRPVALRLLAAAGLLERFDTVTTADEVARGKPAPDIFLLAAKRLAVDSAACLVLEDAEPGVVAARDAGMGVFIVPDQKAPSPAIRDLANGTFDSLADVARHLDAASAGSAQLRG